MADWFDDGSGFGGNLRAMHSTQIPPAGRAVLLEHKDDGEYIRAKVVEPSAIRLVDEGVYQGFSVGIARPRVERDVKARGGRITAGKIVEVSLVDRPANYGAKFQIAKMASNGNTDWVGKVVVLGDPDTSDGFVATPSGILPASRRTLKRIRKGAHVTVHIRDEFGNLEAIEGTVITKGSSGISLDRSGYSTNGGVVNLTDDSIEAIYKGAVPLDVITKAALPHIGFTDDTWAGFTKRLKNDSTTAIQSAMRRISQWTVSGIFPDGLDANDLGKMYSAYEKELVARNPDTMFSINRGRIGKCASLSDTIFIITKAQTTEAENSVTDETNITKAAPVCSKCKGTGLFKDATCPKCKGASKAAAPTDAPIPAKNTPDDATDADASADAPGHDADEGADGSAAADTAPAGSDSADSDDGSSDDGSDADDSAPADAAPAAPPADKPKKGKKGKKGFVPFKKKNLSVKEEDGKFVLYNRAEKLGTHNTAEAAEAQKVAVVAEHKVAEKALKTSKKSADTDEIPWLIRRAHDWTCSAYKSDDLAESYPSIEKSGVTAALSPSTRETLFVALQAALAKDSGTGSNAAEIAALGKAMGALQDILAAEKDFSGKSSEIETMLQAVRSDMNIVFKDANGTGDDLPKPSETITPGQFSRPYITTDRQTETGSSHAPHIPTTTHPVRATDFTRGPLTDGHQRYLAAKMADFHDALSSWKPELCLMDANGYMAFDRQPDGSFVRGQSYNQIPNKETASPTVVTPASIAAATKSLDVPTQPLVAKTYTEDELQAALGAAVAPILSKVSKLEREYQELAASPDPNRSANRGVTGVGMTKIVEATAKKAQRQAARKAKRADKISHLRELAASPNSEMRIHAQSRLAEMGEDA
jgi:hypothetical protein